MEILPQQLPSFKFKKRASFTAISVMVIFGICAYLEFNPLLLFTELHHFNRIIKEMMPPAIDLIYTNESIPVSILQTVAMAILGATFGGTIAFLMALLAAKNTTPHPLISLVVKSLFSIERAIPSLVFILIFIQVVGIGPYAGVLALTVSTIGTFGRLYAEGLENSDPNAVEAIYSTGAHKTQVIRFGIIQETLPTLISHTFYAFDVNLRAAIYLGVMGGGGIGFAYHKAIRLFQYQDTLAIVIYIILMIMGTEKLSGFLRKKALGEAKLR